MEKAEELLRQAVKNAANVDTNTAKLTEEDSKANDIPDSSVNTCKEKTVTENVSATGQSKHNNDSVTKDTTSIQVNDLASTSTKSDSCASNPVSSLNIAVEKKSDKDKDTAVDAINPGSERLSPEKKGVKR